MLKHVVEIYFTFFKMGMMTFGGGYAMLPILKREVVENKKWLTDEDIMDYYAISQGLPGIIAVNVSVMIGYTRSKLIGGITAALGVVSPCILIISFIAACMANFQDNIYVQHAFAGISICVCALIVSTVIDMGKKGIRDAFGVVLCCVTFLMVELSDISPIVIILVAAAMGIIKSKWFTKRKEGKAEKQ
ncbi:chromate transporter [Agathobaculum sp. TL06]